MLLSLHTSHLDVREGSSVPLVLRRPPTPKPPAKDFISRLGYGISFLTGLLPVLHTLYSPHTVAEWSFNSWVTPLLKTLQSLSKALSEGAKVPKMACTARRDSPCSSCLPALPHGYSTQLQ